MPECRNAATAADEIAGPMGQQHTAQQDRWKAGVPGGGSTARY
jgi:hypothetical protein